MGGDGPRAREPGASMSANLTRWGNLLARCRRDALAVIADDRPNTLYRLGLIGERLIAAFPAIDAGTTPAERLMLIGANPADARDVEPGHDSMLHLLWAQSLEWSAMRRHDDDNPFERAPLYWAVGSVMLDFMRTDEAKPSVDAAMRATFGKTFEDMATGDNDGNH
jgi:hypothetical protein